jgi:hypothetical protein
MRSRIVRLVTPLLLLVAPGCATMRAPVGDLQRSQTLLWHMDFQTLNATTNARSLSGKDWFIQEGIKVNNELQTYEARICDNSATTHGTTAASTHDVTTGDWTICIVGDAGGGGAASDDGHFLRIRPIKRAGVLYSGRLNSKRTHEFQPTRQTGVQLSVRLRVPATDDGSASWPAFWFLQNRIHESPIVADGDSIGWPCPGAQEIDLMEMATTVGPSHNWSTTHRNSDPVRCKGQRIGETVKTDKATTLQWHVFTIEMETTELRFFLDGTLYGRIDVRGQQFDEHPVYILINYAVGGTLGGPYDVPSATHYDRGAKALDVDWIRASSFRVK